MLVCMTLTKSHSRVCRHFSRSAVPSGGSLFSLFANLNVLSSESTHQNSGTRARKRRAVHMSHFAASRAWACFCAEHFNNGTFLI